MKINNMIINVYDNYTTEEKKIEFDYGKIINDLLTYENYYKNSSNDDKNTEISLIFVDKNGITEVNKEYRHKNYATDVISFEAEYDEFEEKDGYLGDIFLCIDKVYEQAVLYNHSFEREFAFLLVHGILHLHGYDHMNEDDEKEMFSKQEEILNKFNYTRK